MALFGRSRRDLDSWAVALGAKNDDDAIAALKALMRRADAACSEVRGLEQVFRDLPDGNDMSRFMNEARQWLGTASEALLDTIEAFQRHERGR
jgi:hypothetical protein